MGNYSAFFYGTLMAPEVLYRVCFGSPKPQASQSAKLRIQPAILHDHCRHKVRGADYPAIIPSKENNVRGSYVTGLTQSDVWRLDIFEGDQYERRKVKAKLLDKVGDESGQGNVEGDEVECETYIWIEGEGELEDGEWDFGVFQREKMGRWIGYDDEYEEVDEAVRSQKDPTGGRGFGGAITNQLDSEEVEEIERNAV
ncbi:MAG: hypothetical protein M4579_001630 [Chaenotheca gracillima]|nr:MAG: hypothetical protein M4579_001630 [Chaenotheca gracillima]